MGLVERLKNALFEVEYIEVPKEDPKVKEEKKKEVKEEKPIAKKVILPSKKHIDPQSDGNDFEEPSHVTVTNYDNGAVEHKPENSKPDFKFMDDSDFRAEDYYQPEEPEDIRYEINQPKNEVNVEDKVIYKDRQEKPLYGIDEANKNLVQPYGRAYEKKEEKSGFRPSPIISPIYGVLDKNYKKEDVKEKNSTRISYSRESVNLDEVRNKAYGSVEKKETEPLFAKKEEKKVVFETEEDEEEDNLLVDLRRDDDKPSIKEVTMGDALDYFNDLGLEYNVDYMDANNARTSRRSRDVYDEEPELFSIRETEDDEEDIVPPKSELGVSSRREVLDDEPPVVSANEIESDVDNDDNLFDLIDSMYDEK